VRQQAKDVPVATAADRDVTRLFAGYREILAHRGARAFCSTAFLGRLPVSMAQVGTVFLVHGRTGSYVLAGAMNAIAIICGATTGPVFGRLADRHGQARVLVPQILLHVAALVCEVLAATARAPSAVLLFSAVPAGAFMPSIGALVRARWSWLLGAGQASGRDRAFVLESVIDDIVWTVGPVVAATMCVWHATAGLLAAAAIELSAGMVFALNRATPPPLHGTVRRRLLATLAAPGLPVLLAIVFFVGVLLGTLNIAVVAFGQRHGASADSGWLLGGFAAASMVAGLAFGQFRWRRPADRRLRVVLPYLAVATVALPFAPSPALLAVALAAAGSGLSPTLICSYTTGDHLAPSGSISETLTWVVTALSGGSAAGAALSGAVVSSFGTRAGFLTCTAAAALAAAVGLIHRDRHG
jgi:MFS family permease